MLILINLVMKLNRLILSLYRYMERFDKQKKFADKLYQIYINTAKNFEKRASENKGHIKERSLKVARLYRDEADSIKNIKKGET